MKYFLDTEFIEGTQKPSIFSFKKKTKPTIDLISIGIVSEDNKDYYAISKNFNLKEAWNRFQINTHLAIGGKVETKQYWIRENVLKPIFNKLLIQEQEYLLLKERYIGYSPNINNKFTYKNFKRLINKFGKTNKEIAEEVKDFCKVPNEQNDIEFYTYYAAYDWVVFCWLFGKMIDLPKGFPMFSRDLKVMLDDKVKQQVGKPVLNNYLKQTTEYIKNNSFDVYLLNVKANKNYPKQDNLHNALDDAKWNQKLFNFIKTM